MRLAVSFSLVMRRWSDNLKDKVQLMTQTEHLLLLKINKQVIKFSYLFILCLPEKGDK